MVPSNTKVYRSAVHRPSLMEWLDEVPEHWQIVHLGRIGRFSKGVGGTKEDEVESGIPCIRYGDLYTSHEYHIQSTRSFVSKAKASEYTPVQHGDILFAGSGETTDEIGKSAVILMDSPACCGGDIVLFRPDIEIDARFSGYAMDCSSSQYQKSCMGRGITIMHIYSDGLKCLRIALPPLSEQAAIVRYLDHVDRRIRRYVNAKRKLIALLEEEKQAVINQAVTRGLDPNVRLKPSGVEWLGDIPENWEVTRNGQLFVQRNETGFPDLPILEVSLRTGVGVRGLRGTGSKQMMSSRSEYKRAVKGDIAYNMMRMWQGAVGVVPTDGLVSPAYIVAKARRGTEPRYFSAIFRTSAYMAQVDKYSRGIVKDRNRLYWEDFKQMPIPCPDPEEQVLIADAIDQNIATANDEVARIRRQIDLVEEYRTRLIADVVTGKLDVREAAERLPDEPGDANGPEADGPREDVAGELSGADAV